MFRNVAHTFPEAFGNKWIVSLDECDGCNATFSKYEDSLVKTVGPVLTLSGTLGKGNAVRQTGRSSGPAIIKHERDEAGRRLSMRVTGEMADHVEVNPLTGVMKLTVPVATERFVPRLAYKALVKIGLSLLPSIELSNFRNLLAWVREPSDALQMPSLMVGLSLGSIGNAPRAVGAALLKRKPGAIGPYMVLIVTVGAVCFQIALMSDSEDGGWPPTRVMTTSIRWMTVIGAPGHRDIRIDYGMPVQLDWSAATLELQPLEKVVTLFDPNTSEGRITLHLRQAPTA
jgi:hypothetical protein